MATGGGDGARWSYPYLAGGAEEEGRRKGKPWGGALVKKEGSGRRGSHGGHVPLNITVRGEVIGRRKER